MAASWEGKRAFPSGPVFGPRFPVVEQGALRKRQSAEKSQGTSGQFAGLGGGGGGGCCHPVTTDTVEADESDNF